MGNLTVTVDGVPDGARLTAGQFLGDGSWSVRPADLDGLGLRPSPGHNRSCRLSIRLRKIDKDMGDAFSIGAVYIDVDGDAGRATIGGTDGAISLRRKGTEGETAPHAADTPTPTRRVVRVTRANPGHANPPGSANDGRDDGKPDESPTSSEARPANPFDTTETQNSTDLGIPPPAAFAEVDAPPAPAPEHVAPVQVVNNGIVSVRVVSGLRIGKFGKTGRPEEVVSVRGRGADSLRAGAVGSGSIVFVRGRADASYIA